MKKSAIVSERNETRLTASAWMGCAANSAAAAKAAKRLPVSRCTSTVTRHAPRASQRTFVRR
ncbi:MAG: hypothetical protein HY078_00100 [Elusimicrobia bacterium]|nr:hypothetical protein [Elusimicrobiota bacterium]